MIIVVDDSDFVRKSLVEILRELGSDRILEMKDGIQLVEYYSESHAEKHDIKLIILDVVMPNMSGIEVLGLIRKLDKKVPIVLFSGLLSEETVAVAFELGVKDFLSKPVSETQVNKILNLYLK